MSRPKFVPSKVMDFSLKIREVIDDFACDRHNAPEGIPCFHLRMGTREGYYAAICNARAKKRWNGVSTPPTISIKTTNRTFKKEKR